jgi:hypothetical protein
LTNKKSWHHRYDLVIYPWKKETFVVLVKEFMLLEPQFMSLGPRHRITERPTLMKILYFSKIIFKKFNEISMKSKNKISDE